jgi:hypothetical protein
MMDLGTPTAEKLLELLKPEAGKRHHLGQGEGRKLKAVVAIDRFPIAQGSRYIFL